MHRSPMQHTAGGLIKRLSCSNSCCHEVLWPCMQWSGCCSHTYVMVARVLQVSSVRCAQTTTCAPPTVTTCMPCPRVCLPVR